MIKFNKSYLALKYNLDKRNCWKGGLVYIVWLIINLYRGGRYP